MKAILPNMQLPLMERCGKNVYRNPFQKQYCEQQLALLHLQGVKLWKEILRFNFNGNKNKIHKKMSKGRSIQDSWSTMDSVGE